MIDILFEWNDQTIRWYLDAGAYTGFFKELALKILPYLAPDDTLLDAGCGLGRLDFELAPHVSEITAVDLNERAIKKLKQDIESSGIRNISAIREDVSDLKKSYDVILMSFFGYPDMQMLCKHCRRRIIRIVSAGTKSSLYPVRHRLNVKPTVPIVREELTEQGIEYKLELFSLEFGQPLTSLTDAEKYVLKNAPEAAEEEISEFLSENLTRTEREDFPYYLPYMKEVGIFIIDKEDFI